MGLNLKKIAKPLSFAINPITAGVDKLLKSGGSSGPANPWDPAQVTDALAGLKDTGQYDFLKKPVAGPASVDLTGKATLASSLYSPGKGNAGDAFDAWMKTISAPSSVDQVRSQMNNEQMQALLDATDQGTAKSIGDVKSSFLDRGLGGPGMFSDMEASGIATAAGMGERTKAATRLDYAGKELDMQKEREKALADALGLKYTTTAAGDNQDKSIAAQLAGSDASSLNSLLSTSASLNNASQIATNSLNSGRQTSLAEILAGNSRTGATTLADLFNGGADRNQKGKKSSYLDEILRNINLSVPVG